MSGHSKWNNIKHKKEKTDAQKAKVFTKVGKEIAVAVKSGGPDPVSNSKLKDLIAKAKSLNVPSDNIDRIIKKAAGMGDVEYEEISYEGYGPCGVAVIVQGDHRQPQPHRRQYAALFRQIRRQSRTKRLRGISFHRRRHDRRSGRGQRGDRKDRRG